MPISNLPALLRNASPKLQQGIYVFCCVTKWPDIALDSIRMAFRESEGWTLILSKAVADEAGLPYDYEAAMITLTVNSALEAVGFTAAFTARLAESDIGCNVVAGFHHDHLFVAYADADKAINELNRLGNTDTST